MGAFSNYIENKLLDLTLAGTAFTAPTSWFGALHTADPTETGTGSPLASTPRMNMTAFNAAASATSVNSTQVVWTCSSTGTVSHISIWDGSATATANCLYYGALTATKTVANVGDTVTLASGALTISLD